MKSWINKKIVEYIGEEEPSLCGFICSKVLAQSQPENILQDVAIVSLILEVAILDHPFFHVTDDKKLSLISSLAEFMPFY